MTGMSSNIPIAYVFKNHPWGTLTHYWNRRGPVRFGRLGGL